MSTAHPILFSGPLVRAILAGEKTVTRRLVDGIVEEPGAYSVEAWERGYMPRCPYGAPGDELWVRETWRVGDHDFGMRNGAECPLAWHITYPADGACLLANPPDDQRERWAAQFGTADTHGGPDPRLRPSIHMPRWASRITLRVESVGVERVQAITDLDAIAEGCPGVLASKDGTVPGWRTPEDAPREQFGRLWDAINGKRPGAAWADDPYVWVVRFSRVSP